jgi:hypothetical protein
MPTAMTMVAAVAKRDRYWRRRRGAGGVTGGRTNPLPQVAIVALGDCAVTSFSDRRSPEAARVAVQMGADAAA